MSFCTGTPCRGYDMKLNKELWSRRLVDKKQIEAAVAKEMKEMQAVIDKANSENPDHVPKMPDPEKLRQNMQRAAAAALELVVRGQNIWVLSPGKLTRYDQGTGNPVNEIAVPPGSSGLIPRGDELLDVDFDTGKPIVTHINLTTCEARTEGVGPPAAPPPVRSNPPRNRRLSRRRQAVRAGLGCRLACQAKTRAKSWTRRRWRNRRSI